MGKLDDAISKRQINSYRAIQQYTFFFSRKNSPKEGRIEIFKKIIMKDVYKRDIEADSEDFDRKN